MREAFLHFVWQYQKFNSSHLTTTSGEPVQVHAIGQYNTDSGPDFLQAKVLINHIVWHGHVEIHVKSSDWKRHNHQSDPAYDNVTLHVVWENDEAIYRSNGELISTLELKGRVDENLIARCHELLKSPETIACASQMRSVRSIDQLSMVDQMGVYRLQQKSQRVLEDLHSNKGSWEETAYRLLARNFGFKTNSEPFLKLAQVVPYKIIAKHAHQPQEIEAILFGMAGFLPSDSDNVYVTRLVRDYLFFARKYQLIEYGLLKVEWKFMRMRPANFPTVRLSQFAALLCQHQKFFDHLVHFDTIEDLRKTLSSSPSPYWVQHYDFGKPASDPMNGMGDRSIDVLLINTVAPLLAAYGEETGIQAYKDKALHLLESLKPEKNNIINLWVDLGIKPTSALESQALISLKNDFCLKKRCLSCKIGVSLINN